MARPSRWGNPFTIAGATEAGFLADDTAPWAARGFVAGCFTSWFDLGVESSWWFDAGRARWEWMHEHLGDLRGRDLGCWCPTGDYCHADILLARANDGP